MISRLLLVSLLLCIALLVPVLSQSNRAGGVEIVDRLAAVVNDRVITLSDVEWSLIDRPSAAPPGSAPRKKIMAERLDELIEQELVAQEVEKEPLPSLTDQQINAGLKELESRHGGRTQLLAEVTRRGLGPEHLRAMVRRQLNVAAFIEIRFRPFVVVTPDEVNAYYRSTLIPELQKQGISEAPPVDDVRDQIEKLLVEQKVDAELDKWLSGARKRSRIIILLDREESPNPPPAELTGRGGGGKE